MPMQAAKATQPVKTASRRGFIKQSADQRRLQLIEATLRCLGRDGVEATVVRRIAEEAGLSIGMVRHHFSGKDELLAATYRHLSLLLQEATAKALAAAAPEPAEQLRAYILAGLQPPILNHDYIRARFLFWHLAHSHAAVRKVHDEIYTRFEKRLLRLVRAAAKAANADIDAATLTITIMALLKGIWLEWSLAPTRINAARLADQVLALLARSLHRTDH
ncbi:TetR/AcrR family transcriptional regulator [Ferrovibrio sp.]|uniref:TetR/AcrR family transcriptional regulator n=1 Tax=Ferrovibrio sp. TaxID=1917215 RepID=UPI0025C0C1B5|nr:TetR/AcrR family transcriptional regulator [Ferrovibrio sp.]MBX3455496.1 TetR/AcrR family transcriptional regulator [Ferrovibrio sp.]